MRLAGLTPGTRFPMYLSLTYSDARGAQSADMMPLKRAAELDNMRSQAPFILCAFACAHRAAPLFPHLTRTREPQRHETARHSAAAGRRGQQQAGGAAHGRQGHAAVLGARERAWHILVHIGEVH